MPKETTKTAPPPIELDDSEPPSKKDELIQSLQSDLDREIDARREERFIWLVALMLMFDAFVFQSMQTWTGPLMIGIIQLVVVVALGRRWQMDHIWTMTEKLVDKWDGKLKG